MAISWGSSKFDRLLNQTIALIIAGLLAWLLVAIWLSRDIPFDQDKWKQSVDSINLDIRYRMASHLVSTINEMNMPRASELQELLGPPLSSLNNPHKLTYALGRRYLGPIPLDSWHLQMAFNDHGRLIETGIYPDSP
jgi:hypothetical protein